MENQGQDMVRQGMCSGCKSLKRYTPLHNAKYDPEIRPHAPFLYMRKQMLSEWQCLSGDLGAEGQQEHRSLTFCSRAGPLFFQVNG